MSPGDAAPGPPPSAAGPPRPALSLRATLLAAAAVAYGLILIVGLALVVRVVPRATGIAARGAGVRADFETRNRVGRSLDVAITDLWDQLRAARTGPIPLDSLEARRLRIEGILRDTELLGPLQSGVVSPEFVGALERADRAAGLMAGTLIGAVGALEIRDVATAERLLRRADTLDAPFTEQLSSVTTAALDELARDELRLEREARYAAGLVTFLVLIGLISAPLLWTLLQERLFRPLRALDAALARVDAGDLAAEVPVDRDDEVGRLGVHFNRTTATLRTQRAAGERAAAEAAIAVSEARFRAAFEQAAVGLAEVALDGHVLRTNRAMDALLDRAPDEIAGRAFATYTHPDDRETERLTWERLVRGEREVVRGEQRYVRRDGRLTTALVTATLLRDPDGAPRHVLAVVQDVTEQRRLQQELLQTMKLEAVGQLAGGVAHDFNNLLAGIIGYAELLEQDAGNSSSVREDAAAIRRAAVRGADLSRSLLTLARRNPRNTEPVEIDAIARDTADLVRRTIDRRIEVECTATSRAVVIGDHSLLSNAVLNLAVNARDAMPDGGRLAIRVTRAAPDAAFRERHGLPPDRDLVAVAVADTGHGMSVEVRAHVFEPFFTTKAPGKGTGLGLALVYGTVRDHGGSISIDSEVGRGTTITVFLPCEGEGAEAGPGASVSPRAAREAHVMIVDDDEVVRAVGTRILQRIGYRVSAAPDGPTALERLAAADDEVELVILDGNMPRMSGAETARRIRDRWPGMPIIFASGYFDANVARELAELRVMHTLQKPYSVQALAQTVAEALAPQRMTNSFSTTQPSP